LETNLLGTPKQPKITKKINKTIRRKNKKQKTKTEKTKTENKTENKIQRTRGLTILCTFLLHKKKHFDVKGTPTEAQQQGLHKKGVNNNTSSRTSVWPPLDLRHGYRTKTVNAKNGVRVFKKSHIFRERQKHTINK